MQHSIIITPKYLWRVSPPCPRRRLPTRPPLLDPHLQAAILRPRLARLTWPARPVIPVPSLFGRYSVLPANRCAEGFFLSPKIPKGCGFQKGIFFQPNHQYAAGGACGTGRSIIAPREPVADSTPPPSREDVKESSTQSIHTAVWGTSFLNPFSSQNPQTHCRF